MKLDHVHKYKRIKFKKDGSVFMKCMLPNCPHYIRQELVEGRLCICWMCYTPFQLNVVSAAMQRPHCKACSQKIGDRNMASRRAKLVVPAIGD